MTRSCAVAIACTLTAVAVLEAQDAVELRMQAWSKALGVECTYCHVTGDWPDSSKPVFDFARRMSRMVDGLNSGALKDIGEISCWTCHRGRSTPARLPRESWEKIAAEHEAEFEGRKNRALAMGVYSASLGVDCTHCHEATDRAANTKAAKAMVARMLPIFDAIPTYFDDRRRPVTQCFMCHQGHVKPEARQQD